MSDGKKGKPPEAASASLHDEIHNEDFQFVLKALLGAYQPILEQDLNRAKNPEDLKKEVEGKPPSCADELALANRIFEKFLTEEVAIRLLPPEGRKILGPIDQWRWCLFHIRCCIIFGWLVCRGPRTFRAFVYYMYQYWLCIRQALGTPVANPPTDDQRQDFRTLVEALAEAFKPYLTDQLASVEFPSGIPDEILAGKINCLEGEDEAAAIFERFLTVQTAPALLGKAAFDAHSKEPSFWFCRCWCLCGIRFGCCVARARSFIDVLLCLLDFFRCLRDCFQPLTCEVTDPHGCVTEQSIPAVGIFRGVEIKGTATGAFCDHYTLQWSQGGPFQTLGIQYPGGAPQGACGVVNGTLGYLATFPFVQAGPAPVQIQLCVFSTQGGPPQCCSVSFVLQRNLVWIEGIEGIDALDPFDPTSQLVDGAGVVRSFGCCLRIFGSAWVGGCLGFDIKRYTLSYQPGFTTTLAGPWTQFWQVDYNTPFQIDTDLNKVFKRELTNIWEELKICFIDPFPTPHLVCNVVGNYLQGTCWDTQNPQGPFPIEPPTPPNPSWNSTPLALPNCQSGKYTLRLTVEDTGGFFTDDLQQVWFDNKTNGISQSRVIQIAGVNPCGTINLGQFAVAGGNCAVAWPAQLLGIAYDEFIEEGNFAPPSNNYGGYQLWLRKDGGPWFQIPIPGPGGPFPWGGPFVGTSRVGDPGPAGVPSFGRCPSAVPPPGVVVETPGILALLDMRRLDAVCNPNEPGLTLGRGECCGYVMWLEVWDTTVCPQGPNGRHQKDDFFPFCICNDLPPVTGQVK